jgi:hypothetical protein
VLQQVDEEVCRAVEHSEEVGKLGDVLDPVGPHQFPLEAQMILEELISQPACALWFHVSV